MPTNTSYYSVGGEILGEKSTGSGRLDYVPDALGTVRKTLDQSLSPQYNGAAISPYGQVVTSASNTPKFTWVGTLGYQNSVGAGMPHADYYVRARFYGAAEGRWNRIDPLWPSQPSYGYVDQNPTTSRDPSGLQRPPDISLLTPLSTIPKSAIVMEMNAFINPDWFGDYIPVFGNAAFGSFSMSSVTLSAGSDHRKPFARAISPSTTRDKEYAGKSRIYAKYILFDPMNVGASPVGGRLHPTESEVRSQTTDALSGIDNPPQYYFAPADITQGPTLYGTNRPGPNCETSIFIEASVTADFWRIFKLIGIDYSFAGGPVSIDFRVRISFRVSPRGTLRYKIDGHIEAFPDYEFIATNSTGSSVIADVQHIPAIYRGSGNGGSDPQATMNRFPGLNQTRYLSPIIGELPTVRAKCACIKAA